MNKSKIEWLNVFILVSQEVYVEDLSGLVTGGMSDAVSDLVTRT